MSDIRDDGLLGQGESVEEEPRGIDRRTFLRRAAVGAITTGLAASGMLRLTDALAADTGRSIVTSKKSRVVIVRHAGIQGEGYSFHTDVLDAMLASGLCALMGTNNVQTAWQRIIKPSDRVAIKWNELGGPNIVTRKELKSAVGAAVAGVGVNSADILMWGRPPRGENVPELARGFSEVHTLPNGANVQLTNALERWATALISLPVVKMHGGTHQSIALKLHYGSVESPGALHDSNSAPMWQNIAYLNALPGIQQRIKLIIADATRPQWADGPGDQPNKRWNENALVFATDPIALDSICCRLLEGKRKEVGLGTADDARRTLALAQEIGLGNAEMENIELKEISLG